jgi:uncharacterized protein (DUF433 family)
MTTFSRISQTPTVMGGRPCIRGTRVTVGTLVTLIGEGHTPEQVADMYPHIKVEDVLEAVRYAAWRVEECEAVLS